jgi:chromosome segregation ATPase
MTLKEIKDQLIELKNAVAGLVSSKATTEQISGLQSKAASLETTVSSELAGRDSTIAERDTTIKDLNARLETAQNEVNAKGTEIKDLKEKLTTAENKATEALAAMGVDPKTIPAPNPAAASPGAAVSDKNKTWTQRCIEAKKNAK